MSYYLIVCRSITYAQRTMALLNHNGFHTRIIRTPKALSPGGCSHSVRLKEKQLVPALTLLSAANLHPEHLYRIDADGTSLEVPV